MAEGKDTIGKAVPPAERAVVNRISDAIRAAASGQESFIEDEAARKGAALLFELPHDGFVSALAIMLIPRELKEKTRRIAAIAQPFGFTCRIGRQRLAVVAPQGYVTDFASIPWYAQWIISPFGKHSEAAVIHDWLYTLGTKGDAKARRMADKAFVKALRLLQVNWFKRQAMYWLVRMGGAGGYGLPGDFTFRRLEDLVVLDPLPAREPFMTSFAFMTLPRGGKQSAVTMAAAVEAAN